MKTLKLLFMLLTLSHFVWADIVNPIKIVNGGVMQFGTDIDENWYEFTMSQDGNVLISGYSNTYTGSPIIHVKIYDNDLNLVTTEYVQSNSISLNQGRYYLVVTDINGGEFKLYSQFMENTQDLNPVSGSILNPKKPSNGVSMDFGTNILTNVYSFRMSSDGNVLISGYSNTYTGSPIIHVKIYDNDLNLVTTEYVQSNSISLNQGRYYLVVTDINGGEFKLYSDYLIPTDYLVPSVSVPTLENTTKLYVATFNRAPDSAGLSYWINDAGLDLEGIAQSFFDQPETKEAYPADSSNVDFVEAVYLNLFNRAAEADGLVYWVGELDSGRIAKSTFILAVINGAQDTEEFGNDATILTNKTTVGLAFANAGLNDKADAIAIMLEITDDENSVKAALNSYNIITCNTVYKVMTITYDNNADGIPFHILTYTYDDNGNQLTSSSDIGADGTIDETQTNIYDNNGNLLTSVRDIDADIIADHITTYTYDDNGNLLTSFSDIDVDGTPESISIYTYDNNGDLLTSSSDVGADGIPFHIWTYTYDDNGNLLTSSSDVGADGTIDETQTNIYDNNGNLLTSSSDVGADGVVDNIWTYTYDDNGYLLTSSSDVGADGVADNIWTYTHDNNGNILTASSNGTDGIPDSISTYTYAEYYQCP